MSINEVTELIDLNSSLEKRMSGGEFDSCVFEHAGYIARLVNNSKITSRWWERVLANTLNWKTSPKSNDGRDYGDLFATGFVLGEDNIELKVSEKPGRPDIGGQQCRWYENIPWYLFLKVDPDRHNKVRMFLLHKMDIYAEIFEYCELPLPTSSQGSGKTKGLSATQRRQLIQESFDGTRQDLWGFKINPRSKKLKNAWKRWQNKYEVTIEDLSNWPKLKEKRLTSV